MKLNYFGKLITVAIFLSSVLYVLPAAADTPPGSNLTILSANSGEIILEFTVSGFEVETIERDSQTYHRLIIPGTAQTDIAGNPQVPVRGALLGLPSTQGVTVQVLEFDYDTLSGYSLYPSPDIEVLGDGIDGPDSITTRQIFAPNPAVYGTNAFYPNQLAKIGYTGTLRDQPVGQVEFYPVQYNPVTGEVRLYKRLLARVTWSSGLSAAGANAQSKASAAYEGFLKRTLLNYDTLTRPPIANPNPGLNTSGGGGIGAASGSQKVKIGVTANGIYKITPTNLSGAGFGVAGVDADTVKVKNKGAEIPIFMHDDGDGFFDDAADYLLFYGAAITDIYTTKNIYWLEASAGSGQRMAERSGALGGGTVPAHFPESLHFEQDIAYWLMKGGDLYEDHWFWEDRIAYNTSLPAFRDYEVDLGTLSAVGGVNAAVKVRMKGFTAGGHKTKIYVNGVDINGDQEDWGVAGQIIYDQQQTDTQANFNFQNGNNTIRVEAVGPYPGHQLFINWIEVDYWRAYVAQNNELGFGAPAADTFQFEITGYTNANVERVFDITNPANVSIITGPTLVNNGSDYTLQFKDAAQSNSRYLAVTTDRYKLPASFELDEASNWQNTAQQADYIIITPKLFYNSVQPLATHRVNFSGLSVAVVKVEDIFDEFNFGIYHPQAIKDFLSHAYHNWQNPAPAYVLFVSGATFDYRNLKNLGRVNYVPTHFTNTAELGQSPSDNWFVAVADDNGDSNNDDNDILPEMFIGRLTAQNATQVTDMVNKIIYYEQNPPAASWNTSALFVADDGNPTDGDNDPTFENNSQDLINRLPYYFTANKVYLNAGQPDPPNPTGDITNYINNGSLLVNYSGHGNRDFWAQEKIYKPSNITGLNNTNKLPIVTIANCLNGYFVAGDAAMSEYFLDRAGKGGVAVWADTSLNFPTGHKLLMGGFYDAIFQEDKYSLGQATTEAKINAYAQSSAWGELVETFVLFGDPAMQIGIPTNYPYVENTSPANGADGVGVGQNIKVTFSKPMNLATVQISGSGAAGFTANWNANKTEVTYSHAGLPMNQTLVYTVTGQDNLGNSLQAGPVSNPWSFTTVALAPETASITGPTTGITGTTYAFTANLSPATAQLPFNYTWEATDKSPQTFNGVSSLTHNINFSWSVTGTKTITVTAENVYATVTDVHTITIEGVASSPGGSKVYIPIILRDN